MFFIRLYYFNIYISQFQTVTVLGHTFIIKICKDDMYNILFMKIFSGFEIFQLFVWIDKKMDTLETVVHITQAFGCFNFFIYLAKEFCHFKSRVLNILFFKFAFAIVK